jgi:hypothetical protein
MTTSLRFDRNSARQIDRDLVYLRNMKKLLDKGFLVELAENMNCWIYELTSLKDSRDKKKKKKKESEQ